MKRNKVIAICDGHEVYRTESKNRNPRHYLYINGKKIWLHHYLVEKYIRKLRPGEIVHHIDFNPLNDCTTNFQIVTRAEHVRIHKPNLGKKRTPEQRAHLSEVHKGQKSWNKGMRGFKHSAQSRANMSKAQKGRTITWGDKISASKTKVTRQKIIKHLTTNPNISLKELMKLLNIKSHGPILKYGGLKKLKRELSS